MFRRLWTGLRSPATTNVSKIWPRPQSRTSFFTSRTAYRQHGSGTRRSQPKVLHAGVYGIIAMDIALLVTDESMSLKERSDLAIRTIDHITDAPDDATKLRRFWETGQSLLEKYSGAAVEHHGHLRLDQFGDDQLEARLMVAPDPDVPGGSFILCQAALFEELRPYENRAGQALLSATEAFAQHRDGLARGVLLMIDMTCGDCATLYFDGKRWFNIAFFQFVSPQDLGYSPR
ncbi:hypothetical protein F5Y00DRAFT_246480 [Daldinia vernicosa]|uniref:uncharacterized protein n=1 Tax=Daldinia vernicosa TaxID=114800 RepID=UPI00200820FD|nr:uncharacterized protein F5Y00DRAFT_246480 [Daldinia vernicosa]KAI0845406.1 hypothetical protein F5Y00DRAFT_246480 [Daldinia vernicosa]